MEECKDGACSTNKECGTNDCESKCEMSKMIFDLANDAWAELMKEKMKAHYEKAIGTRMDKVALVGVEGAIAYWEAQMSNKAKCAEFQDKLKKVFMS